MKNKFLQVSAGIGIILLSAGFFVRSFNTAQAAPKPEMFQEAGTSKIGKYQITLSAFDVQGHDYIFCAIIYDTETGESRYYKSTGNGKWYDGVNQLPARPFGH